MDAVCGFNWIDTVVNAYASNSTVSTVLNPVMCCSSPGVCSEQSVDNCPYGYLNCQMGISHYVCTFQNLFTTSLDYMCYQEGMLAKTRNVKCCDPILATFVEGSSRCVPSLGSMSYTACCLNPNDVSTCSWTSFCLGYSSMTCLGGATMAVCTGTGNDYDGVVCAQEFSLGSGGLNGCAPATTPTSGCSLGGTYSPPSFTSALPTTTTTVASLVTPTMVGPSNTGPISAGAKVASVGKKGVLSLCLLVPLLTQLLFL